MVQKEIVTSLLGNDDLSHFIVFYDFFVFFSSIVNFQNKTNTNLILIFRLPLTLSAKHAIFKACFPIERYDLYGKKYSSNLITRKVNSPNTTELIEKLSPFVEYKTYATGRRLPFEQHGVRKCYLVRTGAITLHQQPDDILLGMFEAPSIRGVVHGPVGLSHAYLTLRVAAPSEIAIIEYDKLMVLVAEQGLFSLFIGHLQAVTSALFAHNLQLTQPSAYDVVCNQLVSLMNEPALLRDNTTIEKYIRSKTRLSRSGTMRILAELKLGGYIVVENGVLKYIIHLPAKI